MVEHLGGAIRSIREGAGLSLGALSTRTSYSKPYLCNIEAGRKPVTPEIADALDRALGTMPLISMLWQLDGRTGDDVNRRAFLNTVTVMTGAIGLNGASALAEVVRSGMLDASGDVEDWGAVVREYERRLVVAPTRDFGQALLAQMIMANQQLIERGKNPERLRAAAHLGQLYGLWLGNQGQVMQARGFYRTAKTLATRSGDTVALANIHGRSLSRGVYEGDCARETLAGVHEVLSLNTPPCAGKLEAFSALVHVHALTGNLASGRSEVDNMRRVAEALVEKESPHPIGPLARTESFNNYLECRIGTLTSAQRAFERAAPQLRPAPVWDADARIYFGLAHVRDGDMAGGVRIALDAVKSLNDVHVKVLSVGVQDLLSVVPKQYRGDEVDELRTYSATGPGPWETV